MSANTVRLSGARPLLVEEWHCGGNRTLPVLSGRGLGNLLLRIAASTVTDLIARGCAPQGQRLPGLVKVTLAQCEHDAHPVDNMHGKALFGNKLRQTGRQFLELLAGNSGVASCCGDRPLVEPRKFFDLLGIKIHRILLEHVQEG